MSIEQRAKEYLALHRRFPSGAVSPGDLLKLQVGFATEETAALRKALADLETVVKDVLGQWHHFEAYDEGDRGWNELGDRLATAYLQSCALAAAKELIGTDCNASDI